ncbi:hypothetical protein AMECASPLE_025725 [Ameca splendens]|uniref:Uncharacterized protein n=1 Tax=Ameca splendens TaxID=208324 RepID=A0ABV0XHP8_9TELE
MGWERSRIKPGISLSAACGQDTQVVFGGGGCGDDDLRRQLGSVGDDYRGPTLPWRWSSLIVPQKNHKLQQKHENWSESDRRLGYQNISNKKKKYLCEPYKFSFCSEKIPKEN